MNRSQQSEIVFSAWIWSECVWKVCHKLPIKTKPAVFIQESGLSKSNTNKGHELHFNLQSKLPRAEVALQLQIENVQSWNKWVNLELYKKSEAK